MTSFADVLRDYGLRPVTIEADGRWRRCRTEDHPHKKNGAYVLHMDGVGFYCNWANSAGVQTWRGNADEARLNTIEYLKRRELDRARRAAAIQGARTFYFGSTPLGRLHPYLQQKQLSMVGTKGLREHGIVLLVPVFMNGKIISVQSIYPNGEKRFFSGAPVRGGSFVIDRPGAAVTVVCEGLATGLAIFQCVRSCRVIVAFYADNLLAVTRVVKPVGSVVFCADDDHGTEARTGVNPGKMKAQEAAKSIGAGVVWPFDIEGTDYADALKELGPKAGRVIENQILSGVKYVTSY